MKITIIAVSVSALSQIQIFQKEYAKKYKTKRDRYKNGRAVPSDVRCVERRRYRHAYHTVKTNAGACGRGEKDKER